VAEGAEGVLGVDDAVAVDVALYDLFWDVAGARDARSIQDNGEEECCRDGE
jgi:hypothetical protein